MMEREGLGMGVASRGKSLLGWSAAAGLLWLSGQFLHRLLLPAAEAIGRLPGGGWLAEGLPWAAAGFPVWAAVVGLALFLRRGKGRKPSRQGRFFGGLRESPDPGDPASRLRVQICRDAATGKPVWLEGKDRFLHLFVQGPTGCGKTSAVIKPVVYQDLLRIARGEKLGLTVLEPSGELAGWVAEECKGLGIPVVHIDPENPHSPRFNPLEGEPAVAAEVTRAVLRSLFGRQEAFFSQVQETLVRNTVLLLKQIHGDGLDLLSLSRALRSPAMLQQAVGDYKRRYGPDDLSGYFELEVFGDMEEKFAQFTVGLRQQLADLTGNAYLGRILTGSGNIRLDEHLARGGQVLAVNTAMGLLGRLGDLFGQFVLMHMQSAVFRRPGDESSRVPHFLIIDEFPLYRNPEFGRFLTIARKYRCGALLAVQNASQLEEEERSFLPTVLNNCRNKIWFGGLSEEEALRVEKECGMAEETARRDLYDHRLILPALLPARYSEETRLAPRFPATFVMELEPFHILYKIVKNNRPVPPGEGVCRLWGATPPRRRSVEPRKQSLPAPEPQESTGEGPRCGLCGGKMEKIDQGVLGWYLQCRDCPNKEEVS